MVVGLDAVQIIKQQFLNGPYFCHELRYSINNNGSGLKETLKW